MSRRPWLLSVLFGALAPALMAPAGPDVTTPPTPASRATHPSDLGAEMPAFESTTLQGQAFSLTALRGRPVLVNVWASWCAPCVAELPLLEGLFAQWGPRGVAFAAISQDEDRADVQALATSLRLTLPIILDLNGHSSARFGLETIPVTLLYDASGRLVWRHQGRLRPDDPGLAAALAAVTPPAKPAARPR